jgi:hypothetical protein
MSETTDFYVSWLGPPAFGVNSVVASPAPVPPTPIVTPVPIAAFDFDKYGAGDSTLVNDVSGGEVATINEPLQNVLVVDASQNYLQIYAPDNYPSQTGGITLPSLTNITAIELWLQYPILETYGQYFLDARTGATSSYWINSSTQADISGVWLNGKLYANTLEVDISGDSPNVATNLAGQGWHQLVIVASTSFTDDVALFMRYTGEQGMPVLIAEILVYDAAIDQSIVNELYNARCATYGLPPVVV